MNNSVTSTTDLSANSTELDGQTLPLGSRSRLKTIKGLFELIVESPDEAAKLAKEGVDHTNTLLGWYQQQTTH